MTLWCQDANPKSWCFDVFSFSYARRRGCKKRQDHWDINHDIFIYNIKLQYIILYNHIIIIYILLYIHIIVYTIYPVGSACEKPRHQTIMVFWHCFDSVRTAQLMHTQMCCWDCDPSALWCGIPLYWKLQGRTERIIGLLWTLILVCLETGSLPDIPGPRMRLQIRHVCWYWCSRQGRFRWCQDLNSCSFSMLFTDVHSS